MLRLGQGALLISLRDHGSLLTVTFTHASPFLWLYLVELKSPLSTASGAYPLCLLWLRGQQGQRLPFLPLPALWTVNINHGVSSSLLTVTFTHEVGPIALCVSM